MKKTLVWFGAAFLAAGIAACGGGSKKEETTPVQPAPEMMADAGMMEGTGGESMAPTSMEGNPCSTGGDSTAAGNPCSK